LDTVAGWNPVTYLLAGMRSLIMEGWDWAVLGKAVLAVAIVGAFSMTLCFGALRSRLKRS
jgi:ABC-2 type transport system permease protein